MPVTNKLQPRGYYRNDRCSAACTLNPRNLPGEVGDLVHQWFEAGHNNEKIIELANKVGAKISNGATGRHRKNHLTLTDTRPDQTDPTNLTLQKVNHQEFLEQLVARANLNAHAARVTPEMGLKAIEILYKMNQGSQMTDFMKAVGEAMANPEAEEDDSEYMTAIEAAEAKVSEDEAAQGEGVIGA